MDIKGSEPDKIDDTLASIKLLSSEIKVAVASISAISREINELRDDELLPELNQLIEGYATFPSLLLFIRSPITYVISSWCYQIPILLVNLCKHFRSLLHL